MAIFRSRSEYWAHMSLIQTTDKKYGIQVIKFELFDPLAKKCTLNKLHMQTHTASKRMLPHVTILGNQHRISGSA